MADLERIIDSNPLALGAFGVMAGILCSEYLSLAIITGFLIIFGSLTVWRILGYYSKSPIASYRLKSYYPILLITSYLGLGIICNEINKSDWVEYSQNAPVLIHGAEVTGYVEEIDYKVNSDRIIVDTKHLRAQDAELSPRKFKILLNTRAARCAKGDKITFKTDLKYILSDSLPIADEYKSALKRKGILYSASLSGKEIEFCQTTPPYWSYPEIIRINLEKRIEKSGLEKGTQNFLIAILFGDKNYVDSDTKTLFANAGISHVLALSGLHIGIIALIFMTLLFPICFVGKYKLRIILTCFALWGYACISGMSPSVIRACIMWSFYAVAILLERKNPTVNALFGALLFILILWPASLFEIGFQLSFATVFTIIAFANYFKIVSRRQYRFYSYLLDIICITLISTIGNWVLVSRYFGIFPLAFIPANLIVLPLLPIYLATAIIYIVFHSFGIAATGLRHVVDKGYDVLIQLINCIPDESVLRLTISWEGVAIWYMFILLSAYLMRRNRHKR